MLFLPAATSRCRANSTQSKRITQMWFAKDQGGILVALRQVETDGKEYNIMLQDGTVDGKAVKGS